MSKTTEQIARATALGLITELSELTQSKNDDLLAPWQMAEQKARELVDVYQEAARAIEARPFRAPIQAALDLVRPA